MKGHGQPLLIGAGNGPDGADDPRATRDQDPLAVRGIERDRYVGEDRTGKIATELRDQNGLQERSFMDAVPTGWIGRPAGHGSFRLGLHPGKRRGSGSRPLRGLRRRGQFPIVEFGE